MQLLVFFFFFSSRRRHTRFSRDWSSDVCSSDLVGLTLFTLNAVSATDQWPQFRGLQAGVAADDPTLPDSWSETDNIAWKVPIPGLGWSSPVVWDDHIFLTSAISSGSEKAPVTG